MTDSEREEVIRKKAYEEKYRDGYAEGGYDQYKRNEALPPKNKKKENNNG